MIRLRLASFGTHKGDLEIPIEDGELVSTAVPRVLENVPLGERAVEDVFQVVLNGNTIEPELWPFTILRKNDSVLVAPRLKGGDEGAIFKQIAILTVAVFVSAMFPNPTILSALAVAGASIGTSLLLNALIPPPVVDGNSQTAGIEKSQMYSTSGQSNSVSRYGIVPKVYGTHRMFPLVAANPYSELEVDPANGQLVQYLYAIYDFGLGPLSVMDIKIGETKIDQYSDVFYRLVDLNKPAVSEGPWDDATANKFTHYKGDASVESLAVTLDGNRESGSPLEDYEVIRSAASNPDGVAQTITLNFVNTRGLYAYSASGELGKRSIDLEISFAKVGTEDWKPYNNLAYVSSFKGVGGDELFQESPLSLHPFAINSPIYGEAAPRGPRGYGNLSKEYTGLPFNTVGWIEYLNMGLPVGSTFVVLKTDPKIVVGSALICNGLVMGRVASWSAYTTPGYTKYNFQTPTVSPFLFYRYAIGGRNTTTTPEFANGDEIKPDWQEAVLHTRVTLGVGAIGKGRITRGETGQVYSTYSFTPLEPGSYKVKVTRVRTFSSFGSQVEDSLTLAAITTRFDRAPIQTTKRHTFLEIKIKASNQLNGMISNLSATCRSPLNVYDGTNWTRQLTSNPAWILVDILTGEVNKRALPISRLHLPSIMEWAEFCDEVPTPPTGHTFVLPRFECNFILDYNATLQTVVGQVCSASQASLNIVDGKYGVLIDKKRTTPVQIFTPRNSKDFSSQRVYTERPHALRVKFIDAFLSWSTREVLVCDDGYTEDTATNIDDLTTFGCTNAEQAWRFGRYNIAQNKLRQETIAITTDFEHLVCTRGDFVQVVQDVMKVGGRAARVKSVVGTEITIDDDLETNIELSYGYVLRTVTGEIKTGTLTVLSSDSFDLNGDLPSPGDLIVIGEVGKVVYDCIVKSITPNDDLTANLILIEKADAVYDAESTDTFPAYDPQITQNVDPDLAPPPAVVDLVIADSSYRCSGAGYEHYIDLDWNVPIGSSYESFEVYVNSGKGFTRAGVTQNSLFRYIVEDGFVGVAHNFKVVAISASGKKLDLSSVPTVSNTPQVKNTPPSNVQKLDTDITGEVLQLVWPAIEDCDCDEYVIRYSPSLQGSWGASIPLLRVDRNTTLAATQARTGTYLIKAVDYAGNESTTAARAVTSVPNLFGLNVIEEIDDFPTLIGAKDRVEKAGNTLVLQKSVVGSGSSDTEYYAEGYYYYKQFLDLGEIYSVRLQSLITAEGLSTGDLVGNWEPLSSVTALSNSRNSDWDVEAQYRSTDRFNSIADWVKLSDIDPISEGAQQSWTPWRKFIMGDATGRIFQFRLRLTSNKLSVTPRVFGGIIRADMPDRIESFNNLVATEAGYVLTYPVAFKGPGTSPNVQISIDNAQPGDYWEFDYKLLTGFKIIFYDQSATPVSRQFDVMVKGYGRKADNVI